MSDGQARDGGHLAGPRVKLAAPVLGSTIKAELAELAELAASLIEEVAPVIAAAARGTLDVERTIAKLDEVLDSARLYLGTVKAQLAGRASE